MAQVWCRCLCYAVIVVALIGLALAVIPVALYLLFRPQLPMYWTSYLHVSNFLLNQSAQTLTSNFQVTITAQNPNQRIGIYYLDGGNASVEFNELRLGTGAVPAFYQGYQNTSFINLELAGTDVVSNSGMLLALLRYYNRQGRVPLLIRASLPLKIKLRTHFFTHKTKSTTFSLRCQLHVDKISANYTPSVIGPRNCDIS